jgi:hypothetical protein
MSDIMIIDSNDIFVVVGGVKVAKRGHAGTPEAGTWISLRAGWTVTENDDAIDVTCVLVH